VIVERRLVSQHRHDGDAWPMIHFADQKGSKKKIKVLLTQLIPTFFFFLFFLQLFIFFNDFWCS